MVEVVDARLGLPPLFHGDLNNVFSRAAPRGYIETLEPQCQTASHAVCFGILKTQPDPFTVQRVGAFVFLPSE